MFDWEHNFYQKQTFFLEVKLKLFTYKTKERIVKDRIKIVKIGDCRVDSSFYCILNLNVCLQVV